jgi:hypothetical protein
MMFKGLVCTSQYTLWSIHYKNHPVTLFSDVPRNFFRGGSTNSVEDRGQNGDLGAVPSYSGVQEAAVIWYKKFHFI